MKILNQIIIITANCSKQAGGARDTTLIPHSGALVFAYCIGLTLAAELDPISARLGSGEC
jgi:hypothetical protein